MEHADRKARRRSRSRVEIAHDLPLPVLYVWILYTPKSIDRDLFSFSSLKYSVKVPLIIEFTDPSPSRKYKEGVGQPTWLQTGCSSDQTSSILYRSGSVGEWTRDGDEIGVPRGNSRMREPRQFHSQRYKTYTTVQCVGRSSLWSIRDLMWSPLDLVVLSSLIGSPDQIEWN